MLIPKMSIARCLVKLDSIQNGPKTLKVSSDKKNRQNFCKQLFVVCLKSCLSTHITRQTMHVQRNWEALSRNHCCRAKAVNITHFFASVCVCVNECVRVRGCGCTGADVRFGACRLTNAPWNAQPHHIFVHYLTNGTIIVKKVTEHKRSTLIFSTTFI